MEEGGERGKKRCIEAQRGSKKKRIGGRPFETWQVNEDKEFWESLKIWDAMVLLETWVEEKGWEKVKKKLPGVCTGLSNGHKKARKGKRRGGGYVNGNKEGVDGTKYGDGGLREGNGDEICGTGKSGN